MTINATAIILLALYVAVARRQGVPTTTLAGHGAERHPQGVRRARHLHLPAARVAAHRHRHLRVLRARAAATGTRSRSAAITSARPARRRCRRWRSRSPTRSPTSQAAIDGRARRQHASASGSRSSSTPTTISSRRSRSSARRGGCGRGIMRERFGATNPRAQQLRFHTQTAGSTLTAQQPDNNIVRVAHPGAGGGARRHAVAALQRPRRGAGAADRGVGAHRAAHAADHRVRDAAWRTPSIRSPASYAIEALTNRDRERGARRCSSGSTRAGGTLAAIEQGFIQREIQESAYRAQQADRHRRSVVVGVNQFTTQRDRSRIDVLRIDPDVERAADRACARGARVARPAALASGARRALRVAARGDGQPRPADHPGGRSATRRSARSRTRCARCSASITEIDV